MSKKTPIRIFLDLEDHAKLSHLAGDAMETPNKLGAFYLENVIRAQHAKRTTRLAQGLQPEPKVLEQYPADPAAASAEPTTDQQFSGI